MANAVAPTRPLGSNRSIADAADAVAVASRDLVALAARTSALEPSCVVVERLGTRLSTLAREPSCPERVRSLLLDWRSRLSSHLLAARTLQEVNAAPHLPLRMVRRGVTELSDELAALPR